MQETMQLLLGGNLGIYILTHSAAESLRSVCIRILTGVDSRTGSTRTNLFEAYQNFNPLRRLADVLGKQLPDPEQLEGVLPERAYSGSRYSTIKPTFESLLEQFIQGTFPLRLDWSKPEEEIRAELRKVTWGITFGPR